MAGTARQVHLGRQLRQLRTSAGVSLEEAAAHLERSRATVGHWERGHSRVSAKDLDALLKFYRAPEDLVEQLQKLRRESGQRGWWQSYKLPSDLAPFVGFEAEASEIFHYELGLIPGLLQTEGYARAVHEVGRLKLSDAELQSWVDVRLKRQERLNSGGGLTLHAVIAEEALHRVVGSRTVMVDQLEHLIAVAKRKTVNLQVLPFSAGAHAGSVGPITVLRFDDASHDDVAFSDTPLGGHVIDDLRDVAELSRLFSALQAQALSGEESEGLLRSIADAHAGSKE
ncbi:helix-turn-helix domain-containing protein [Saccharopolyspora indica]|uniref:helix-turn-helix domain-containing protein n=1 Tax=Saccharopolyspora indica TaxID=1229659 RepID=UPI0022EB553A|nr:helix-turn-helix transcriptional regulator [Saccharopolyspora indica]MDA3646797.1 helix-turn-helix transcriptional regulator [Saccharopolyspora indica]